MSLHKNKHTVAATPPPPPPVLQTLTGSILTGMEKMLINVDKFYHALTHAYIGHGIPCFFWNSVTLYTKRNWRHLPGIMEVHMKLMYIKIVCLSRSIFHQKGKVLSL